MRRSHTPPTWPKVPTAAGVTAAYVLAAHFGLSLAQIAPQVTPIWPPAGIALAALVLLGIRLWPAIALGALLANLWANLAAGMPWKVALAVAAGIAIGNTLEAVVGASLLRAAGFRPGLRRVRDVVFLVGLAGLISTTVSATGGVLTLALADPGKWPQFRGLWWTWWLGDAMGDLIVAPVLLVLGSQFPPRLNIRVAETAAFFTAIALACALGIALPFNEPSLAYLAFPFFAWSALRLSQGVTAVALVIASGVAVYSAIRNGHTAPAATLNERLLMLQTFMGVLAATSLATGAGTAQRRAAERTLREHEEQLRLATEASGVGVWTRDTATDAVQCSPLLERIFGLEPGAFGGTLSSFRDLVHPDDRETVDRIIRQAVAEHREYEVEFRFIRAGETRWMIERGRAYYDDHGNPTRLAGVGLDVTERKRVEEELLRYRERLEDLVRRRTDELEASHQRLRLSERMAALGTLAAGLGHDMGNLLLPIQARLDVLRAHDLAPDAKEDIEAISQCAQYLLSLSRGLRALARDPDRAHGATDLQVWWREVGPFFTNVLARPLALHACLPQDLPPVAISSDRLTQAVFNLVSNAREAVEHGNLPEDRQSLHLRALPEPDLVRVSLADDGPGMSEEVRRRCLEPFFTTKPRGISTGLGLSLVHGIVSDAGGSVQIDTRPGRGTTISLLLPLAPSGTDSPRPTAWLTVADQRTSGIAAHVLEALGFSVVRGQRPTGPGLWVTEPTADHLPTARHHHGEIGLIVLGKAQSPWLDLGAQVVPTPNPSAIRAAVEQLATPRPPSASDAPAPAHRRTASTDEPQINPLPSPSGNNPDLRTDG